MKSQSYLKVNYFEKIFRNLQKISRISQNHQKGLLQAKGYAIHDIGRSAFELWIIYPRMSGNLLELLKNEGLKQGYQKLSFSIQISDTIRYLHNKNIVHGNLKPTNILYDEKLHAKVTDWE